jgi:hypothetical protein
MVDGREEGAPAKARRPPWGFLGMLGLVMAIEANLAGNDLDFTAPWHWDWRVIGKAATRPERVRDKQVLCFGDSMVKFGVIPKVLKQVSGKTAYNFALHTGQTSSSYFMLRRALRAGARPSAIVLDLTPHMLMDVPEVNKQLWSELLTIEECLDLSRTMKDPAFFASVMLAEYLPSYKERHDIRAGLMAALQGRSTSRRLEIPSYRRNWKINEGAQLMADTGTPRIDVAEWVGHLYSKWEPNPVNLSYLDRFLALAESRKIPVYWVLTPIHPLVQAGTDANGFDLSYTNFVRLVQSRFPTTIVVDARHAGFPADHFVDGAHVNRPGALKLSAALGEILREPAGAVPAPRWVGIEFDRVRRFDLSIEDVNQSTLVLKADAEATARR